MSAVTQKRLFDFWDVLDDLLNLLLFGLIGLVMMSLTISALPVRPPPAAPRS